MKKILWITERFPPMSGGMSTSAQRQVSLLRRNGYQVDVMVFVPREVEDIKLDVKNRDCGNDIFILYADSIANATQKGWQTVLEYSRCEKYDLIIGFGCNQPGLIATTYACWLGVPSMVSVRGNDFDRDWFDSRRHAMVADTLSRADTVCCVTQEKVDKIQALYSNKMYPDKLVTWLPNGIDTDAYKVFAQEHEKINSLRDELGAGSKWIIGIFGEIKYKKRIPFLIEVLRSNNLFDKVSLLLVGKMDYHVDSIFKDHSLVPQFKHISFRSQDEIALYYNACDFVAIPSMFEGFPNVLLEGMVCGNVPLVSDSGAMPEVISHKLNGFIFKTEDYESASASVIDALAMDKREYQTISDNARQTVLDRFSQEHELESLKSIIETTINSYALRA